MFPSKALLSLILASLAIVDASPLSRSTGKVTLNLAKRFTENGPSNVLEKDRARIQAFQRAELPSWSVDATNALQIYTAQVGVGSPPTDYTLIVDTGSSNTWIGANTEYTPTSTSHNTGNTVSVTYGSGSFSGEEWVDTITLAPGLVIENQSIGVASSSTGFVGFDGILGVGRLAVSAGTVNNTVMVPTVMDNLFSQGTIFEQVLGIYFVPVSESTSPGSLTFGGIDDSVTTSEVAYVPITTTSPSKWFWGIDQSISYGGNTILSSSAGVIDSGSTLILIAPDAFQKYQSATGATLDPVTELLTITSSQYANLQPLTFNIGGVAYDLCANGQIWPRSLNTAIGGTSGSIYLVVSDIGTGAGPGLNFINGYSFLERYYTVFDASRQQVGFASTPHTGATTN